MTTTTAKATPAMGCELGPEGSRLRARALDPILRLVARSPVHVLLDTTLRDIAAVMAEESIGAVQGPAGIVSERDLVLALAEGADPDRERARDVMTPELDLTASTDTILSAADLMLAHEIRHLAVTAGTTTVGVVSIRDVLATLADDAEHREAAVID